MVGAINKNASSNSARNDKELNNKTNATQMIVAAAKAAVVGIAAATVMMFIISCLAVFYDISDAAVNYAIIAASIICLFLVGFKAAGYNNKNGLIIGIISGLVYTLILFLAALMLGGAKVSYKTIIDFLSGCLLGGLGGVVGINRGHKKRKRR